MMLSLLPFHFLLHGLQIILFLSLLPFRHLLHLLLLSLIVQFFLFCLLVQSLNVAPRLR